MSNFESIFQRGSLQPWQTLTYWIAPCNNGFKNYWKFLGQGRSGLNIFLKDVCSTTF